MRRLAVTLHGRTFEVTQHDDGTFEMPPELAALKGRNVALKPGQEMWWLARKPLEGTVAGNVLEWGTGALNIGACRVGTAADLNPADYDDSRRTSPKFGATYENNGGQAQRAGTGMVPDGRWPANVVLTHSASCEPAGTRQVRNHGDGPAARGPGGIGTNGHSGQDELTERRPGMETVAAWRCAADCPVGELDRQSGVLHARGNTSPTKRRQYEASSYMVAGTADGPVDPSDSGGASRFYPVFRYQAKAPASERPRLDDGTAHETVKPLGFISWAVRLITPPGGTVLDLFGGSGPVAEACIIEGFRAVIIERERKSADLIVKRLSKPIQPVMFGGGDEAV